MIHQCIGFIHGRSFDPLDAIGRSTLLHGGIPQYPCGFLAQACADGWNPKMIGFLVLMEISALNIVVEVGLVTGVIPMIIPIGSAIFESCHRRCLQ